MGTSGSAITTSCFTVDYALWLNSPMCTDQSPAAAIAKLKEGNGRYIAGNLQHPSRTEQRCPELASIQHPFAVILTCSDSRVAPEIIFNQGLGDLFVIRVAGNVISDEVAGSIEYAVDYLGTRLIVVMGHQTCGAVKAAREAIAGQRDAPGHIKSIVKRIKPAVEATPNGDLEPTVKANVKHAVQALRSSTPILKSKVDSGEVRIIGTYYSIETGAVSFFDHK
jgi:carbonic anhydrase